nr:unnamed protein product [Spirometra erinaceieuropaei]
MEDERKLEMLYPCCRGTIHRLKHIGVFVNGTARNRSSNTPKDTAGQERFRTLTPSFYRGAHAAVIIFDLCNRESFESLEKWFHEIWTYTNRPNLVRLLIGNKLDLEQRQVTRDEALRFARLHKLLYAEVSAKTNEGVSNSFYELFEKVYSNTDLWIHDGLTEAGAVRLNSRKSESRKSACSCG